MKRQNPTPHHVQSHGSFCLYWPLPLSKVVFVVTILTSRSEFMTCFYRFVGGQFLEFSRKRVNIKRLKLGTQKTSPPGWSKGSISLHLSLLLEPGNIPKGNLLRHLVKFIEVHIFVDFNPFPFYHYTWSFFVVIFLVRSNGGPGWKSRFSCFSFWTVQEAGINCAAYIWAFPKK